MTDFASFPLELILRDRHALVVGVFPEAAAKIARLLEAGARVTVLTEGPAPADIEAFAPRVEIETRRAVDADLVGKALVYVAPWATPDDEARARRWHADALHRGALLCTADRPETCTFTSVGIARAAGLTITVSSGGRSPGLVRRIREDLEAALGGPRFARFASELAARRAALPRGERAASMAAAVRGFALHVGIVFPAWFDEKEKEG